MAKPKIERGSWSVQVGIGGNKRGIIDVAVTSETFKTRSRRASLDDEGTVGWWIGIITTGVRNTTNKGTEEDKHINQYYVHNLYL